MREDNMKAFFQSGHDTVKIAHKGIRTLMSSPIQRAEKRNLPKGVRPQSEGVLKASYQRNAFRQKE